MVSVVLAAFLEGIEVGFVGLRPVGTARLAVRPAPSRSM
jgi:hypothetical protein